MTISYLALGFYEVCLEFGSGFLVLFFVVAIVSVIKEDAGVEYSGIDCTYGIQILDGVTGVGGNLLDTLYAFSKSLNG